MKKRFVGMVASSVPLNVARNSIAPALYRTTYIYVAAQYRSWALNALASGHAETGRVPIRIEEHHEKEVVAAVAAAFLPHIKEEVAQAAAGEEKVDG